jgi:hypothetical protein
MSLTAPNSSVVPTDNTSFVAQPLPRGSYNSPPKAADKIADTPTRFHRKLPGNDKVLALARILQKKFPREGSKNAIALRFANGDRKKAQSLLRQIRRYRLA